jgi:hypothetical protein
LNPIVNPSFGSRPPFGAVVVKAPSRLGTVRSVGFVAKLDTSTRRAG